MSYQGLPPLAPKVQTCIRIFNDLQHLQTPMERSVRASVDDHLSRFRIWSGNIGARQSLPLPTSLDYRLREAPKTAAHIAEVLDVLIDTLEELLSVLVSGQGKHTEPHHDLPLDALTLSDAASDIASLSSDQSQPQSELEELLGSCADTISSLFRSSALIRSATSRDRYAKATAAGDPLSEHYDIEHVGPRCSCRSQPSFRIRLGITNFFYGPAKSLITSRRIRRP